MVPSPAPRHRESQETEHSSKGAQDDDRLKGALVAHTTQVSWNQALLQFGAAPEPRPLTHHFL